MSGFCWPAPQRKPLGIDEIETDPLEPKELLTEFRRWFGLRNVEGNEIGHDHFVGGSMSRVANRFGQMDLRARKIPRGIPFKVLIGAIPRKDGDFLQSKSSQRVEPNSESKIRLSRVIRPMS